MPTEPRLTPLLRKMRAKMAAEAGFTCLRWQVTAEEAFRAFCCGLGVDEGALAREWAGLAKPETVPRKLPPPKFDEPVMPEPDDDDDDDELQQDTRECPNCRGLGRDKSGAKCSRCNGSGRVPTDDVDDDEEEAKTYHGEFEDEE